jgi:hypothetical protein
MSDVSWPEWEHVLPDLRERFDEVLEQLESVAGWRTARVKRPVMILGSHGVFAALANLDALYPQPGGESALQQLQVQLGRPLPYDLEGTNLSEYRRRDARWHDWCRVSGVCAAVAVEIFRRI